MGYVRVPVETNPLTLLGEIYAFIQAAFPGWQPNDANLDTWLAKAFAFKAAESRSLASDVPDSIFEYLGSSIFAIPPIDAVAASASSTWTLIDTLGHTIPAGTIVGLKNSTGDLKTFAVVADVTVFPGSGATAAGAVQLRATEPGVASNGLDNPVELVTVLDWVTAVVVTAPTSGGVDAETENDYLDRLVRDLQLLTRTPILAKDFAQAAQDADPSVFRAVAIDLYDPVANTYGHDRTVTIAALDINGNNVSGGVKTNIQNYLNSIREVNFVVHTMDPIRSRIDVHADIKVLPGHDATIVTGDVVAGIQNYLAPNNWATDPTNLSSDANRTWVDLSTIYHNELVALVSNVTGVDRVSALTANIHGNAPSSGDIAIPGPASVTYTNPGDVTATAV